MAQDRDLGGTSVSWRLRALPTRDGRQCCRPTVPSQSNFEKALWTKTSRTNARQEGEEGSDPGPGGGLSAGGS